MKEKKKLKGFKQFAKVYWTAIDVQTLRPKWSEEKCSDFLDIIEERISEAMCEAGWDILNHYVKDADCEVS